jgi:DNA repair protein RadC
LEGDLKMIKKSPYAPIAGSPAPVDEMEVTSRRVERRRAMRAARAELRSSAGTDREILQTIFAMAGPNAHRNRTVSALFNRFRTLGSIVNASSEDLMASGVAEREANALALIKSITLSIIREDAVRLPVLDTSDALKKYLLAKLQHEKVEAFFILYLNSSSRVIGDEVLWRGTVNHYPAYPREVLRRCLEIGADRIILAHNRPLGVATPSWRDATVTKDICDVLNIFNIPVLDHVIVGAGKCVSLGSIPSEQNAVRRNVERYVEPA